MAEVVEFLKLRAYEAFACGDYLSALDGLRQLEHSGIEDAELFNDLAVVLHRLGRHGEAIARLRKSIELGGDDFLVGNLIARK